MSGIYRGTSAKNLNYDQFISWANSLPTKELNDYVYWDTVDLNKIHHIDESGATVYFTNPIYKKYKYSSTLQWLLDDVLVESQTLQKLKEDSNEIFEGCKDLILEAETGTELGRFGVRTISNLVSQVALDALTHSLIEGSEDPTQNSYTVSTLDKNNFLTNTNNSIKYNSQDNRLEFNSIDVTRDFSVAAAWYKDPINPHRTNLYITSAYENTGENDTTREPFIQLRPRIAFKNLSVTSSTSDYSDIRFSKDFKYLNVVTINSGFLDREIINIDSYIPNIVFDDYLVYKNTISRVCEAYNEFNSTTLKYDVKLKFWSNKNLYGSSIPLAMFTKGELKLVNQ